jgi:hypothetical protein
VINHKKSEKFTIVTVVSPLVGETRKRLYIYMANGNTFRDINAKFFSRSFGARDLQSGPGPGLGGTGTGTEI